MSLGFDYKDSLTLIDPVIDGYGTEKIGRMETVACYFIQRTSQTHSNNQDQIESDAVAYLDSTHFFLLEVGYQIQGMLVVTGLGLEAPDTWYRIVDVTVAEDKLLANEVEHIKITLKKTTAIEYVS